MGQPYAWVSSHAYHLVHSRETVLSCFQPKQAVVAVCLHYINGNHPPCSLCLLHFSVHEVSEIIPLRELLTYFQQPKQHAGRATLPAHQPRSLKCDARKPAVETACSASTFLYIKPSFIVKLLHFKPCPTGTSLCFPAPFCCWRSTSVWIFWVCSESSWGFWLLKESNLAFNCYCASCRGSTTKQLLSACFYRKRGRGRTEPIASTGSA